VRPTIPNRIRLFAKACSPLSLEAERRRAIPEKFKSRQQSPLQPLTGFEFKYQVGMAGFKPATCWSQSAPGIEAKTGNTRHLSDHNQRRAVVNTCHRYPRFTDVSQMSVVGKW
jgi:hypothetical protein